MLYALIYLTDQISNHKDHLHGLDELEFMNMPRKEDGQLKTHQLTTGPLCTKVDM